MTPPLPDQIVVTVIIFNITTGSFSVGAISKQNTDGFVFDVLSDICVDNHDFFYSESRPPRVEELRIEEVVKNPPAFYDHRWLSLINSSSSGIFLYILPHHRPSATERVDAAVAESASPSEYAQWSVFSASQTRLNIRLMDGYFVHDNLKMQLGLDTTLACVPARFFYDGFMTAAKDLRKIKSAGLGELKARAEKLFGPGKVVEEFTPDSAVDRADMVSFLHTVRYTEEMTWRTMTQEAEAELLGLEKLRNDSSLRISWEGAKEAEVDGIRGLGRWPLAVEVWKKEDGSGLERLQGAQGLRKHQLAARKAKNTSLVNAPVNIDRGVFPGLVLSHRGADVTVGYSLRAGNRFAYEVGETMRLSKDGATDAKNELGDTRVAVFFGTLAKLCREMYAFVCAPGVAPCLPNILCGGEGEFGPESNQLHKANPRVLQTTWTPRGAGDPLDVVVKFMTRSSYGKEAHELASRFAPKLHHYGHVDEGFYVAVMDFVPGGVALSVAHESTLKQLRQHFKDNDIVHGDLRPQNLVFRLDGSVTVLDWDWGGVRSKDKPRYPMAMIREWDWHRGAVGGELIEHEHDCYQLDQLQAKIDEMKRDGAQKRKADEDVPGAEDRKGTPPTSL